MTTNVGIEVRETRSTKTEKYRDEHSDFSATEYVDEPPEALIKDMKPYLTTAGVTHSMTADDTRQSHMIPDVTEAFASFSMQDPPAISRQPSEVQSNPKTPINRGLGRGYPIPGTGRETFYLGAAQSLSSTPMLEGGEMYFEAEHKLKRVPPPSERCPTELKEHDCDPMSSENKEIPNPSRELALQHRDLQTTDEYLDTLRRVRIQPRKNEDQSVYHSETAQRKMAIAEWLRINPSEEDRFMISVIPEGIDWKDSRVHNLMMRYLHEMENLHDYIRQEPAKRRISIEIADCGNYWSLEELDCRRSYIYHWLVKETCICYFESRKGGFVYRRQSSERFRRKTSIACNGYR